MIGLFDQVLVLLVGTTIAVLVPMFTAQGTLISVGNAQRTEMQRAHTPPATTPGSTPSEPIRLASLAHERPNNGESSTAVPVLAANDSSLRASNESLRMHELNNESNIPSVRGARVSPCAVAPAGASMCSLTCFGHALGMCLIYCMLGMHYAKNAHALLLDMVRHVRHEDWKCVRNALYLR